MSTPFLGEIRPFPYNFAPAGWATCQGQILAIAQNTALFALLGTTYGGNGQTTFALPHLSGRAPVGEGQGPGLAPYTLGEQGGSETVTLLSNEMPQHSHFAQASTSAGNRRDPFSISPPAGNRWAASGHNQYAASGNPTPMHAQLIGVSGGSQPHNNRSPFLTILYCIALEGVFPPRN